MEDSARNRRIGPASEAGALEPGDPAFVVTSQSENGLEVRDGPAPVLDDDSLAPAHAVDQGAEPVLGIGYTGSFHIAIIARPTYPVNRVAARAIRTTVDRYFFVASPFTVWFLCAPFVV